MVTSQGRGGRRSGGGQLERGTLGYRRAFADRCNPLPTYLSMNLHGSFKETKMPDVQNTQNSCETTGFYSGMTCFIGKHHRSGVGVNF